MKGTAMSCEQHARQVATGLDESSNQAGRLVPFVA
jgi:hypothetical protein